MAKSLVVYFSATGNTKELAKSLADTLRADLHEIVPKVVYTKDDLNWENENSRSSKEMNDKSYRPVISNKLEDVDSYDTIYLAYPIWWGVAPTIVNTFLESYDFTGKNIITLATSGSSDMGDSTKELEESAKGAKFVEGKILKKDTSQAELESFVDELNK